MKRERKKLRVQLVDEDMILLKVPDKGIVEWKILQVSKDFVEFEYALDDVIFRPGEWNECTTRWPSRSGATASISANSASR